ncbi:hypothetical protein LIER_19820 [Lithospermum erythrorhizon]|uniref:Uncharacterized protein n=1 Tax=Lithospermum erythrorhizon TaxID=34254 RepID=A0AAV3QM81_LITER
MGHEVFSCDMKYDNEARQQGRCNKYYAWMLVHGERRLQNRRRDYGHEKEQVRKEEEGYGLNNKSGGGIITENCSGGRNQQYLDRYNGNTRDMLEMAGGRSSRGKEDDGGSMGGVLRGG